MTGRMERKGRGGWRGLDGEYTLQDLLRTSPPQQQVDP